MPNWVKFGVIAAGIFMFCMLFFIVVVPYIDAGWVRDPSASISDPMLQLALWTITTVFALSGAILGLNWYQGERRYQEAIGEITQKHLEMKTALTDVQDELLSIKEKLTEVESEAVSVSLQFASTGLTENDVQRIRNLESSEAQTSGFIKRIDEISQHYQKATKEEVDAIGFNPYDDFYVLKGDVAAFLGGRDHPHPPRLAERLRQLDEEVGERHPLIRAELTRLWEQVGRHL